MTSANRIPAERVYSAERDAILRRDWPAGISSRIIWDRLAHLPGPMPSSRKALKSRAHALGITRPENWSAERADVDYAPWPQARLHRAIALYQDASMHADAIVALLNSEFPTLRAVTWKGVAQKMQKAKVRRAWLRKLPAGRPPIKHPQRHVAMDQPMQPRVPSTLEARMEKAARMIEGKGRDFHVWSVVAHTGLEAWQVCCIAGRLAMGLPLR